VIVAILLAAGQAKRFGSQKLLAIMPKSGHTVVETSAANLLAGAGRVIAVTSRDERLMRALDRAGCEIVVNEHASEGMATSIVAGIGASMDASGWLIALGDMPYVEYATISKVKTALEEGADIAIPRHRSQRGHPVGFSAKYRDALLVLTGDKGACDKGAKAIIDKHQQDIVWVGTTDPGVLADIDLPEDLR
jgi:molybdenum cofactor cytidylyltransferase